MLRLYIFSTGLFIQLLNFSFPIKNQEFDKKYIAMENIKLEITIGKKVFTATLVENATSKAFVPQLPLTLNMNELNNNEKFAQIPKSVPTLASVPNRIEAGDLMMYDSSTLVLFYKGFSTSYSYTKIGKIDDVTELSSALGKGNVMVTFKWAK